MPAVPTRVLVTGAASGIGAATVSRFRQDNARVGGVDIDSAALDEVELDARTVGDVTVADRVNDAVDEACASLSGLDVLVCCAGVVGLGTVADTELPEWERIFAVNVRGLYLTAKAAIPHLRAAGGGAIVNVASQLGVVAVANAAAYCASKGAAIQLTRAMAVDHAVDGIRVNTVSPGPTWTPRLEGFVIATDDPVATRRATEETMLHRRLIEVEAIAYLASPRAGSTTGANLVVDGGYTIRQMVTARGPASRPRRQPPRACAARRRRRRGAPRRTWSEAPDTDSR